MKANADLLLITNEEKTFLLGEKQYKIVKKRIFLES